jgi:hypothetical protein
MSTITPSPFLTRALFLDVAASGPMAILLVAGAGVLEGFTGLPTALLRGAGLVLLPYVAFVLFLATRREMPRGLVWLVIAVNAIWTVDSIVLLVSGQVQPTLFGYAFVIAQAVVVGVLAELQVIGLKRSTAVARSA